MYRNIKSNGVGKMKALMLASVASMIDQFNMENIALLQNMGYKVDVACNFLQGSTSSEERMADFRKELEEKQIRAFLVPIPRKISAIKQIMASYRQIKNLVEQEKYQLVHCHSPIGGAIARMACREQRKKGLRVIYTAHGFHFYTGAPKKNWMIFYPIEKWLSKYTDVLITICKEDYERAKQCMNAKKIVYIPGIGVDAEGIGAMPKHEEKRQELGLKGDDKLLLSIGELNRNKNHEVILRAMAKLQRKDVHLAICGKGKLENYLKQLAKELGIEKQVHLLGFRTDAKEWLTVTDIFVFPSFREGLPVSLMEAMAAGLPVVATKIRGTTDLVVPEKGGYLHGTTQVEQMAFSIGQLLDDDRKREEMGNYNKTVIRNFSIIKVQEIMKTLYESK